MTTLGRNIEVNTEREAAKVESEKVIATILQNLLKMAVSCGFNADNLQDDIDHPLYWYARDYCEALQIAG